MLHCGHELLLRLLLMLLRSLRDGGGEDGIGTLILGSWGSWGLLLSGKHLRDWLDIVERISYLVMLVTLALAGGAPLRNLDELLSDLIKELLILDQVGYIWKLQVAALGHVGRRSRRRCGGGDLRCTNNILSGSLILHHWLSKLRLFRICNFILDWDLI